MRALLLALRALAQDPGSAVDGTAAASWELRWEAPPECPTHEHLRGRIAALLEASAGETGGRTQRRAVTATLRVYAGGAAGYELDAALTLREDAGADATTQRHLQARTCDALADAAALVVALAVDPRAGAVPSPAQEPVPEPHPGDAPRPSPQPEPVPPRDTNPAAPSSSPEPRRPTPPLELWTGAAAGVGAFALPSVTATVELRAELVRGRLHAGVATALWTPTDGSTPDPRYGGRFLLWNAAPQACFAPGRGRVDVPLCLLPVLGLVHGQGRGELVARQNTAPWVALGGGAAVRVRVHSRLALRAGLGAAAVLLRPSFVVDGAGRACCTSPWEIHATLGLDVRAR